MDTPPASTPAFPAAALCALLGGVALAFCQWLIFVFAPVEETMGIVQKIFYIHLPLAWWGLISFFLVFVAGIAHLVTGKPFWDALAGAAAEVGVVLAALALVTGSLWARRSWGVWWTWDPRLTTTLIMWFIYAGYLIIRSLDLSPPRRARIAAVVGIVAFLDVPLVFFSARLWRSIHPAVFASRQGGMDGDMKIAVFTCVAAFGLVWASLTALRFGILRAEGRLDALTIERVMRQA